MKDGEVAFEWFERADYPNIRQVMEDKHRLPASFEDWAKSAEAGEQALANSRHIVVRTMIESHTFASWCRERDIKANAQSRLKYCNEQHANTTTEAEDVGGSSARIGVQADKASEAAVTGIPPSAENVQRSPTLLGRSRDLVEKAMRGFRSLSRYHR